MGLELRARGHSVTIATSEYYRAKIERIGLRFAPMGPHLTLASSEMMQKVLDQRKGPDYLIRQIVYPSVPSAYSEVMAALRDADIIVTHPLSFAAQIAAEKTGMPWISTVPAPTSFFSRFEPPVFAPYPSLARLYALGPVAVRLILSMGRAVTRRWMRPIIRFRSTVGLPPGRDPIFDGQHSPQRVLALFSRVIGEPQPDWPAQTLITGFLFYDGAEHGQGIDPELKRFLDAGPAPVVFTLGSSAVEQAGSFYLESLQAVRRLGCRAVLLAGSNRFLEPLPPGTAVFPYAPFSQVFPRASAIVHSGGIGTSAQALAAGRPMVVVPFAFDQPDNAARLKRLGLARVIPRKKYHARRAEAELNRLFAESAYAQMAIKAARRIAEEDGVRAASDAIERHVA